MCPDDSLVWSDRHTLPTLRDIFGSSDKNQIFFPKCKEIGNMCILLGPTHSIHNTFTKLHSIQMIINLKYLCAKFKLNQSRSLCVKFSAACLKPGSYNAHKGLCPCRSVHILDYSLTKTNRNAGQSNPISEY